MCQGADPVAVETQVDAPKSIGHGKVIPPDTKDKNVILTYLLHMSEKVATRLRRHQLKAQHFSIGLRIYDGWLGAKTKTTFPTQDGQLIYKLSIQVLKHYWQGEGIHQVQITATDPQAVNGQLELFDNVEPQRMEKTHQAMDEINQRYGEFCLAPARLLHRSSMPNVIAPAWKPFGHRQTIESTGGERTGEKTGSHDFNTGKS
jgi:DNA polymerase-4